MSLAVVYSRACVGINAPLVTIEVHLANGLPAFNLVGLAETAVRESKERVRSALLNSGFEFPAKRITVNLAPADLPKEGGRFDLAIALGIIAACGLFPSDHLDKIECVGELALTGDIRSVSGVLPFAYACAQNHRIAAVPATNASEAGLVTNCQILSLSSLTEMFLHLSGRQVLSAYQRTAIITQAHYEMDLADIKGQHMAKRALEISAAGNHNILFCGPPGSGKTMLAQRLLTILPQLEEHQALESATIRSVSHQQIEPESWQLRPFRQPHHTSSAIALVGGGSRPKPGEISLAHHGVLFLDELPEFDRKVLDVLREPLESGQIHISRAAGQVSYPASFQLVAAMNPSPTGSLHDGRCTSEQILKYLNRISGPFLDRVDIQVDVPKLAMDDIYQPKLDKAVENSETVRQRVVKARTVQHQRAKKLNAHLTNQELETHCVLSRKDQLFLRQAAEKLELSMRAFHRVMKIARTIADLELNPNIQQIHLAEALSYRALDNIIQQLSN